jgi:dihydrofolate reductase
MRKIVVSMSVSVDGFIEDSDQKIDWHLVDEELHAYFNQQLAPMGAFMSGRVTYELMAEFWPTVDAEADVPPVMIEFAAIWREMPKIVFSRTLDHADGNTTIKRDVVRDEILALKDQPGGDLALGGANVIETFAALNLIDEYAIYVHPVTIGAGTRLFPPTNTRTPLRLTQTRQFGNGVVLLRYAVAGH